MASDNRLVYTQRWVQVTYLCFILKNWMLERILQYIKVLEDIMLRTSTIVFTKPNMMFIDTFILLYL